MDLIERLTRVETKVDVIKSDVAEIKSDLKHLAPIVDDCSWWIEKLKWGFIFITICAVLGGIVSMVFSRWK